MKRWMVAACAVLAACGGGAAKQKEAAAEAAAAKDFVPPAVLSRLDFGGMVERRFQALDRNQDSFITPDELPRPDSPLMRLDADGDGKVSSAEYSAGMLARFDRDDFNHDGTLTTVQRRTARAKRAQAAR